jgi:hypothetical protein
LTVFRDEDEKTGCRFPQGREIQFDPSPQATRFVLDMLPLQICKERLLPEFLVFWKGFSLTEKRKKEEEGTNKNTRCFLILFLFWRIWQMLKISRRSLQLKIILEMYITWILPWEYNSSIFCHQSL